MSSSNSNFVLEPASPCDYPRLGEIQYYSFGHTDAVTVAVFLDVSKEDYVDWVVRLKEGYIPEPGSRKEIVTARDVDGTIVGWAQWAIPTGGEEVQSPSEDQAVGDRSDEGKREKVMIPKPKGMKEDVWDELQSECRMYEKKHLGDRPHWSLNLLIVDPAYQRRGAGRQLVQDGMARAQAAGYPIWLSASASGKLLYQALGFKLMEEPLVTSAKFKHAMMLLEAPGSDLK